MLTRKLKVGDRVTSARLKGVWVVTELSHVDGVVWISDGKESTCFIAWFGDGTFNMLCEHVDEGVA